MFEFTTQEMTSFLIGHGYWIMFVLMYVEGPFTTLVAGFLVASGTFNIFVVFLLSVLGDVLGDIVFYFIGRYGGMRFVKRWGKYIGMSEKTVHRAEQFFTRHGGKTIFLVKSTTGLCMMTFITAGIVKMKIEKFLFYTILGGLLWSGIMVTIGYFFGNLAKEISQSIAWAGWVIGVMGVATVIGIIFFQKKQAKNI
ncbi:MAG: DedA family protein [Candidatus Moranbacteria bacterium]|nr:DedA family protein [Candidatus Moranbacteria bacterium]